MSARTVEPSPSSSSVPDGGWGWAVVFGSFMIQFFADGVSYGYLGLLYTEVSREFRTSKSAASWIGSISLGFTFGSGPIAGALVDRFGCRLVAMAGSLIASFGFGISYFAKNLVFLYFSVGVTGGLGLGLVYLPAMVCISYYFEKRRAFATGIAVAGSGIGSFSLAPLFTLVIQKLGLKYSLVVVASVLLLCVLFAALFRPLPEVTSPSVNKESVSGEVTTQAAANKNGEEESLGLADKTTDTFGDGLQGNSIDQGLPQAEQSLSSAAKTKTETASLPLRFTEPGGDTSTKVQEEKESCCRSFFTVFKSMMDFKVMLIPVFTLFAISNFLTNFGTNVPYIQLADLAVHNLKLKESDQDVGFIVGSVGISNSICRLILGYLSDKKWMNRLYLYSISLILAGIVVGATAHAMSVPTMMVCAAAFGATGGLYVGLTPIVLTDLLGIDRLSNSFGIVLLFQGLGTVIGAPVVGALYDNFGSYIYGFWLAGGIIAFSGAMLCFIPCMKQSNSEAKRSTTSVPHLAALTSIVLAARSSFKFQESQRSIVKAYDRKESLVVHKSYSI